MIASMDEPRAPERPAPPIAPELIEGVRLRLRRSTVDDATALHRVAGDPAVMRYLEWPASPDLQATWQFLSGAPQRWAAGQEHHWAVVTKADGAVIGSIAARLRGHTADFGVMIDPDQGGRGLGREAAGLLVGWLLRQAAIERVWAAPDAQDARSRRLLEQLGFACEGVMRSATVRPALGALPRDAALYAKVGGAPVEDRLAAGSTVPMAPVTASNPSVGEMERRVARFAALVPTADYVDAGIPGCERTTWRVLGVPPDAPLSASGFHLNLVRCEPGRSAPLHNHLTPEVFIALTGRWEVFWGPEGARALPLGPWDTIVIPPGVSRGFRNVGAEDAMLIGIAEGREPGRINWTEAVRAAARAAGVELPVA
jgi:RimJ/RimL family protein N-acetyltransferase/mannose-6-phosphate isomerase-like protein (cupin superfamily)